MPACSVCPAPPTARVLVGEEEAGGEAQDAGHAHGGARNGARHALKRRRGPRACARCGGATRRGGALERGKPSLTCRRAAALLCSAPSCPVGISMSACSLMGCIPMPSLFPQKQMVRRTAARCSAARRRAGLGPRARPAAASQSVCSRPRLTRPVPQRQADAGRRRDDPPVPQVEVPHCGAARLRRAGVIGGTARPAGRSQAPPCRPSPCSAPTRPAPRPVPLSHPFSRSRGPYQSRGTGARRKSSPCCRCCPQKPGLVPLPPACCLSWPEAGQCFTVRAPSGAHPRRSVLIAAGSIRIGVQLSAGRAR